MPLHAADFIKTLITKRKLVDKNFSVQLMCDDLNLPKSTIDKFLSKQTTDTSWNNVAAMVSYLGGSLDELAGIQRKTLDAISAQFEEVKPLSPPAPAPSVPIPSDQNALSILMESHKQEIQRITDQQTTQLDRFRRLIDQGREALIAQHTTESAHMQAVCQSAIEQIERHRKSFEEGRNSWRLLALVFLCLLVAGAVYLVWEFSNLYGGFTGYLLRQAGLISTAGVPHI